MFWHKKEDKSALPDLPAGPNIPASFPDESEMYRERNALPSFPDSPSSNKFSESIIKGAISDSEIVEEKAENPEFNPDIVKADPTTNWEPSLPEKQIMQTPQQIKFRETANWKSTLPEKQTQEAPQEIMVRETDNWKPSLPEKQIIEAPQEFKIPDFKPFSPPKPVATDVFIKIEKYHAVKRALTDVRSKLEQIDELLSKIRDIKLREEQELVLWEKEIANSKVRIEEITKNIFEKV